MGDCVPPIHEVDPSGRNAHGGANPGEDLVPGDPRIGTTYKDVLYCLHLVVAEDAGDAANRDGQVYPSFNNDPGKLYSFHVYSCDPVISSIPKFWMNPTAQMMLLHGGM
jgi:hypothetical protein